MAAFSWTTFSNAFSWMKMYKFRSRFHWSLFPWVNLAIFQHWFRWWLLADQARSHHLNQWWLLYWCIYASLGHDELNTRVFQNYRSTRVYLLHSYLTGTDASCIDEAPAKYKQWKQNITLLKFPSLAIPKVAKMVTAQGSTLTVVRLGIPSSFCCRTTWTNVHGCPLVKLRKLTK